MIWFYIESHIHVLQPDNVANHHLIVIPDILSVSEFYCVSVDRSDSPTNHVSGFGEREP